MTDTITRDLAEYVTSPEFGDVPERVAHENLRAFVNFVGCASADPVIRDFRSREERRA
jgi:hypothetical protein